MPITDERRLRIRRQYRTWRAAADLTQEQTWRAARDHYPEFGSTRYWRIENADDFPTPSERRALAAVFGIAEAELPTELEPAEEEATDDGRATEARAS